MFKSNRQDFLFDKSFLSDQEDLLARQTKHIDIKMNKKDEKSVEINTDLKKYVKIY
jgi:hypothetical protein